MGGKRKAMIKLPAGPGPTPGTGADREHRNCRRPDQTAAALYGSHPAFRMEGAGKLVEDEELREAMSQKGLGTPATRASIIEGLIFEKYILREARELVPTAKAFSLITLLRGLQIPELSSPELTGDWEFRLKQMERGELGRTEFMSEIEGMTRRIIEKVKAHESDTVRETSAN